MLGMIFIFTEDGNVLVRCMNLCKNKHRTLYTGDLSDWDAKSALKKYGKCIMVCYSGCIITSVSQETDPLLSREICDSDNFLSSLQDGTQNLLFVNVNEVEPVRARLRQSDAVLLQEQLSDSPNDFIFPELRIANLSDEKLSRFLLQKLKEKIVITVVIVFALVSVSYGISASIGKQNAELSIQLSKNRKEAGKADDKERNRNNLYSKMTAAVSRDAIYAFDRIVVSLPPEIRLTSAVAQSDILTVEGVFESSDALSETMKSISRQAFVEDIEASRIDTDSKGNRIFTLKIWLR